MLSDLAASTLAARVAASMRADPYAVVSTGLGAMTGALHGGAALGAEIMLGSADSPADAPRVVGDVLRRGEKLPGFGHFVYRNGDPRANLLLRLIGQYAPDSERLAVASAVTAEARRRRGDVRHRPDGWLARTRAGGVRAEHPDPATVRLHRARGGDCRVHRRALTRATVLVAPRSWSRPGPGRRGGRECAAQAATYASQSRVGVRDDGRTSPESRCPVRQGPGSER